MTKINHSIPFGWKSVRLRDLTEKIGSGVTPQGGSAVYIDRGVMLVRSQNIQNDTMHFDDIAYITSEIDESMKATRLKKGDVLYNITGASIGRSAVFEYDFSANVNQHVCIIRLKEASPQFVNYWLRSVEGARELYSFQAGGNREGLNFQQLGSFVLTLPERSEQDRIVKVLETWDRAIALAERKIACKRAVKQWLMQQLLTGQSRLPRFSGEWKNMQIGDVSKLVNGYAFKSTNYIEGGKYKIVTIASVQDGELKTKGVKTINELPQDLGDHQKLIAGDILVSMTGNVGRVCRVTEEDCLLNQRVGKLIPTGIFKDFFYYSLRTGRFLQKMVDASQGGAQGNIGVADIKGYSLSIPEHNEQKAIADVITSAEKELEFLKQKLNLLKDQKKYLLNNLVTGAVRTPEDI